ncbi:unnamed protein product [Rotaria socialis]
MEVDDEEEKNESKGVDEENFNLKLDLPMIGDLLEMCKSLCGPRNLPILIYTILRYLGLSWRRADDLLRSIGANTCETALKWAKIFISGDIEIFQGEGRGGKHYESFFDVFTELKKAAKAFAIESYSRKSADFTAVDLANFIDTTFYELTQTSKLNDTLVRSIESCRLDLRRWLAKFQPNTQRPYFEGHERQDVVTHRHEFISYFLQRKDVYYTISDGDQPVWKIPAQNPCIILFHVDSTFKSGEMPAKRWTVERNTPFFSKGHGRSHMISDFIVQHPCGPFFSLSDAEYDKAVEKFPSLSSSDDLNYVQNSVTAGINVGVEGYFSNEVISSQFERLFQLVSFKQDIEGHQFEVVVDNARTDSAREYPIGEFSKGIGMKCPVNSITYVDDKGKVISISCRFTTGDHRGKTKGLVELAKELKLPCLPSIKLTELQTLLAQHAAFQNVSKIEILARKYNIKSLAANSIPAASPLAGFLQQQLSQAHGQIQALQVQLKQQQQINHQQEMQQQQNLHEQQIEQLQAQLNLVQQFPGRTFRSLDPIRYSRVYAGKSPYPAGKHRKSLEHGSSIPVKNTTRLFRRISAKFRYFLAGIDRKSPEKMRKFSNRNTAFRKSTSQNG